MMKKMLQQVKNFKELLFLVGFFLAVIGAMAGPFIDKRIDKKQAPVITELKEMNRSLEFQNYMTRRTLPAALQDSIDKEYQRYFPRR